MGVLYRGEGGRTGLHAEVLVLRIFPKEGCIGFSGTRKSREPVRFCLSVPERHWWMCSYLHTFQGSQGVPFQRL